MPEAASQKVLAVTSETVDFGEIGKFSRLAEQAGISNNKCAVKGILV